MSKEKLKNKNHTSHFAPHTSNKGITLIALIITIIVMLILTGVTLIITLGDNGLVNKAKEATETTEIAMDRELLLSAVVGSIGIDGKVNFSAIVLPEGFTGSNGTYTSKNGYTFTVSGNGEIVYTGEGNNGDNVIENGGNEDIDSDSDLELLRNYFLGEVDESTGTRPGKDFTELFNSDFEHFSEIKFGNNEIIENAENDINVLGYSEYMKKEGIYYIIPYIEYNNNYYGIEMYGDENNNIISESLYPVKKSSSVDLSGTYYSGYMCTSIIIENDTLTRTYDDGGSYIHDIEYMFFNEENQTVGFTYLEDGSGVLLGYEFIYENGIIVNKILKHWDGQGLLCQNLNGFEFELEGIYLKASGTYRLVFDKETHMVDKQSYVAGEWGFNGIDAQEGMYYFKYKGINYVGGESIEVSEDLKTITYGGTVYTKQEVTE